MHAFTDNIYIVLLNSKDFFKVFAINSLEGDEKAVSVKSQYAPTLKYCTCIFILNFILLIKRRRLLLCLLCFKQVVKGTQNIRV